MIRISDPKQGNFFDPWDFLSPKRRKLLDQSWAGLFQKELLCELPVRELAPFFTDGFGRPSKELHTVLGALVLQQTHDLTDEETVDQLSFGNLKDFGPPKTWDMPTSVKNTRILECCLGSHYILGQPFYLCRL